MTPACITPQFPVAARLLPAGRFLQACAAVLRAWLLLPVLTTLLWGAPLPAQAHKPSDSYLSITRTGSEIQGQWDIALRDLEAAIGLDTDSDGALTWSEVRSRHEDIAAYALSRLRLSTPSGTCDTRAAEQLLDRHTDGTYAVLHFTATCPAGTGALEVDYQLLFDIDPQHKGLLKIGQDGVQSSAIFGSDARSRSFDSGTGSTMSPFLEYLQHGVWHIWIGFDHILFLVSLLLPAVLVRRNARWEAADDAKSAALDVLKVVTAFTIAHSITLTLATLEVLQLPSRWVESVIAASVVIAALNNVLPIFPGKRWVAAFAFGLIHGFGFASVLGDLGLPASSLVLALLGFNLGVELGQLAIVIVFLPLAFAIRQSLFYRRVVFNMGSLLIALIASLWFVERAFDVNVMPI